MNHHRGAHENNRTAYFLNHAANLQEQREKNKQLIAWVKNLVKN